MSVASDSSGTPSRMSVANDSSGTPSKILIDKDLQSTAQEKEVADEVPSQFKSPAEIKGYPKAIHQYETRKRRQQGSSKILTDSPKKKSLVEKKKKQEEKEKTRKRKPKKADIVPRKKRSKLWNYFEELNSSLVKCTTCKKEIKTPNSTKRTKIMRTHILNVHGISLDDDTLSLPDDLRQCYSELPGYKAKCKHCDKTLSFLSAIEDLRKHLRRTHSTTIQSRDETDMVPRKNRSKFWNYFEKLNPSLVKCTTCKKEIKISYPDTYIKTMRIHLSRHGIFLGNDTLSLPDDLRQCYSVLPGYKAKCINCGKTLSFLTTFESLRKHLRRHSTITQGRDEADIVLRKKRSKLWNYFEELNPSLVKCTTCKKEIKTPNSTRRTIIMRTHILNVHEISLDDDIRTIPDDLRQCYSELPGYKAKCINCGKTLSFLTTFENLRKHLRSHSTITQGRDEMVNVTLRKKHKKFWNYFEKLNPLLVKCRICKKEIKIPHPKHYITTMRIHLTKHGISLDDTRTLPDNLKQCYSELPGCKAKCNNCGQILSFLTTAQSLRRHLRSHSTIIQGQDETVIRPRKRKCSKLWNYFKELNLSLVKCTICKKEIKVSHPTYRTQIFRAHLLKVHGISFDNDIRTLPVYLKKYYSELPKYRAKCNDCGRIMSFLTSVGHLRRHLLIHSIITQGRDEADIVPAKKRSKFWNYFEKLNRWLIKCTICKKEIKISHPEYYITTMRTHLTRHEIFLNNGIRILPDDLRQCYSELPGYKAKCNNCGKVMSCITSIAPLRKHLRRKHSTTIQSRDEADMVPRKNRSKSWNYFEKLNPSLIKCTICKKEIKISRPDYYVSSMRSHLTRHEIFPNNGIRTLPDDLRQCYSELPGYKAKCKHCDKTLSFKSTMGDLRKHLRSKHPTTIQSRDEADIVSRKKRNKLWNYFEELNRSLVKCTTCKKEIKTPNSTRRIKIMRAHILNVHGISLDDDTLSLPDDLRQCYSELPGYKAKCKHCDKTLSFLSTMGDLRKHLKSKHSTITHGRDEADIVPRQKRSKLWNYFEELNPSLVKCTTCKKEIKISHPDYYIPTMRRHLARHGIFLNNDIRTLPDDLRQCYSELPGYKAKCKHCDKTLSCLSTLGDLRKHLRRKHSTTIQSRDEPSTSSLADSVDPSADRQSQDTSDLPIQSLEEAIEKTDALDKSSTLSSTASIVDPSTGNYIPLCQSQKQVPSGLHVQSFKETAENTGVLDEPSTSSSTAYIVDPSAGKYIPLCQSQEQVPSGLHVQSFRETAENTGVLDEPNTSSSADYVMDPSAEHQSGEPSGLPVQSFEPMTEETSALHSDWFYYYTIPSVSSSTCYVMAPSAEHQSGEQPGSPVQSLEPMTEETIYCTL